MSHRYHVDVSRHAIKALSRVARQEQQRIRAAIDLLSENPRPPNCVAMVGEPNVYRVRVGDYRIVYEVFDDRLKIHVIRIGHRKDVYRM